MSTLKCVGCGPNCNACGTQEGPSCYECVAPFLLEEGLCKVKCEVPGNRPNPEGTQCVDKTNFPVFGPVFSVLSLVIVVVVIIVKRFKKETNAISSLIAFISIVETFAILMNLFVTVYEGAWKYTAFCSLSIVVLIILNIYNYFYIKNSVMSPDAAKEEKLKPNDVKAILQDIVKRRKREDGYAARESLIAKKHAHDDRKEARGAAGPAEDEDKQMEGGSIELKYVLRDENEADADGLQYYYSPSDDEDQFEGGATMLKKFKPPLSPEQCDAHLAGLRNRHDARHIVRRASGFYETKYIEDKGFNRWV